MCNFTPVIRNKLTKQLESMTNLNYTTKELRTNSKGELRQVVTDYIDGKKVSLKHYEAFELHGELHIMRDHAVYTKYY